MNYSYCYICGKKVDNDMCFCPYCGEKFKAIDEKEDEKYITSENNDDIVKAKLEQEVSAKKHFEENRDKNCGEQNSFPEEEKNIPYFTSNEVDAIDKQNEPYDIKENQYGQVPNTNNGVNIDNQGMPSMSQNNTDLVGLSSKFVDESKKEITSGRRVMNIIGSFILWIFSIFFMLLFLITIFSRVFVSATVCLMVSLFINPLIFDKLINRKIKISRWICVIVIVFGFLLATVSLNLSPQL